jgi:DNA-binding transcriptional LysR family regulator
MCGNIISVIFIEREEAALNIHNFLVFDLIVQKESFTKAARALNFTQPAISTQIKQLENKYDVVLFERNNNGVQLTEAGKIFHHYSLKILELYNEMEVKLQESGSNENNNKK